MEAFEETDELDEEDEPEAEAEESARGRTFGAQALRATVAAAPVINSAVRRVTTEAEEGPVIVAFQIRGLSEVE